MKKKSVIGIDLGGTKISAGIVTENGLTNISSKKIKKNPSVEDVVDDLFSITDLVIDDTINSIGIGVPGLVDAETGSVFDLLNIPSWKETPLKEMMESRYHLPVKINNDANCFALGEYYFGKGKGVSSMIGLTVGTGLGAGLILNKKLYSGKNFGAGEFGMIDYLDHVYEYYASGQYFENVYKIDGEEVFKNAQNGNADALRMYEEMGMHLGNAIKTITYALNVELIVLGGSVRFAYSYFSEPMWQEIRKCAFKKSVDNLKIEISDLKNSGILGAAALAFD